MGGEPLSVCSDNRKQIISLCKEVKKRFPKKDIWVWSGFLFEEIVNDESMRPILDYIDVLVDGPFIQEKKDLATPFRGSSNQRVIDVKKTLDSGKVVEMQFGN
jgi:anaerobic ribonucleoside-triphosphate reductase activating protein